MRKYSLIIILAIFSFFTAQVIADIRTPNSGRGVFSAQPRRAINMDLRIWREIFGLRGDWMPPFPIFQEDQGRGAIERDSPRWASRDMWNWWYRDCQQNRIGVIRPRDSLEQCTRIYKLAIDSFEGQ